MITKPNFKTPPAQPILSVSNRPMNLKMKLFHKLHLMAGLIPGLLSASAFGNTIVISDNFNIGGDSAATGFAFDEGVNQGINPPTTRLTGTAKENLRYFNRNAGKADSSFWIDSNKFRVNTGAQNGRASFTVDDTNPFDFGPILGVAAATAANPIVYEIKVSMDNNAASTQRMSLGLATTETDANNWDFGLQIYKAAAGATTYTVQKRINTSSISVGSRNDPMFTHGTAAAEVSFVIRVTDAGAESGANYNSRVQVSKDNGATWSYDTASDPVLTSGFRFDGAGRFFSFDVAGNNSSFVTYDGFSVTLLSPTWNGAGANNNWSTGGNWSRGVKPTTEEDVVFSGSTRQSNVNDLSGLSINSLQLATAGFSLSGNPFTVVSAITNVTGDSTVGNSVTLGGAVSVRTTAGTLTLGGDVDGTGSLTKTGNGTLQLTGANTYTGATTVSTGTLLINGSLDAASAVSIAAAATLGGSGTVNGTVSVSGTLSPGSGVGTLTTGGQTWNTGGKYLWEISDSASDQIIASSLDLAGNSFTLDVTALEALTGWDNTTPHSWTIVHTTGGGIANFDAGKFAVTDNFSGLNSTGTGGSFRVSSDGTDLVLHFSPIKAVADAFTRSSGSGTEILVSALLANDLKNAGTISLAGVSATTAAGGQIEVDATTVYYNPPAGNPGVASDTFTYTISDGTGGSSTATVTVTTTGTQQVRLLGMQTAGLIKFNGIPNTSYKIEYTGDLTEPITWTNLTTVVSSANGSVSYQDLENPLPPSRYYRIVVP